MVLRAAFTVAICCGTATAQNAFRALEPLGGHQQSHALQISANGGFVCGRSIPTINAYRATRWETATGTVDSLGVLPGKSRSLAAGISDNGATVTGWSDTNPGVATGFTWTPGGGMIANQLIHSNAISDDASIVGGERSLLPVYIPSGGALVYLESKNLPGAVSGASSDGGVLVGATWTIPASTTGRGAVWYLESGTYARHELPEAPGATSSYINDVSAGSTPQSGGFMVGYGQDELLEVSPFHYSWMPGGISEMTALPLPAGAVEGMAEGVSQDGLIVVGWVNSDLGSRGHIWKGGFWSESRGVREVLLYEYGLDVRGWCMTDVTGISDDGTVICGNGVDPDGRVRGWVATTETPLDIPLCPADHDMSGFVDTDDFDAFMVDFESGDARSDLDGSCFVDLEDATMFLVAYERGC
ncbi:MAG: hypothetical protein AMXMBFR58_06580 [Phycisphaerae bacterium]|nr:hypothetical protein [Phycisphaerales bacterium]